METQTLTIKQAVNDEDILLCWEAVSALRPHLRKEDYLAQTREMMKEGYHMIFVDE